MEDKVIDFDTHMRILNFLIHIQSIGLINEEQRVCFSEYIQDYLKERRSNIELLESLFESIKDDNNQQK